MCSFCNEKRVLLFVFLEYFLKVLHGNAMYFVEKIEQHDGDGVCLSTIPIHAPILGKVRVCNIKHTLLYTFSHSQASNSSVSPKIN